MYEDFMKGFNDVLKGLPKVAAEEEEAAAPEAGSTQELLGRLGLNKEEEPKAEEEEPKAEEGDEEAPDFNSKLRGKYLDKDKKEEETKENDGTGLSKQAKKWIEKAIKKPGALHKDLDVPEGKKIPESKIEAAAKKKGKVGKRARLAETLEKMREKDKD